MQYHKRQFRPALLASASIAMLFTPDIASAQSDGERVRSASSIQDIIVTARKSEENLQGVPIAVTVQTGEALAQRQVNDFYSLQNVTPSLQTISNYARVGAPIFAIRGIGTSVSGPQIESSVGVVIDDVPMSRVQLTNLEFFDIDRVEVLRGPQGMLFGKNAAAGLVNVVTGTPKFDEFATFGRAYYGNMNTPGSGNRIKVNLGANLPFGDSAALRVTAFARHDDAFVRNIFQKQDLGQTSFGGQAKLRLEPSDSIRLLIAADYATGDGPGEAVWTSSYDSPGGTGAILNGLAGITASRRNVYQASGAPNDNSFEVYGTSLKAEFDVGDGWMLSNVLAYRRMTGKQTFDSDTLPIDLLDFNGLRQKYRQVSEELRITSPASNPLSFQAGVFYLNLKSSFVADQAGNFGLVPVLGAPPPPYQYWYHQIRVLNPKNESYAAFFEGQYKVTDHLRFTAGARYTHETLDFLSEVRNQPDQGFPLLFGGPPSPESSINPKTKEDNVSYRFILNYDIAPDVMAYASYARGYKGPTFDQVSGDRVNPEIPKVYELGLKSTFFDRRLRLNIALFHETFSGFQTQVQKVLPGSATGTGSSITVNAGKLKARGVEAEFTAVPFDGLTINGGVTFNDTKYVGLAGLPCYPGQPVGIGRNLCDLGGQLNFAQGLTDASGNQLAQAPKWTEILSIRYETAVSNQWNGFVQGDGVMRSGYNLYPYKDPNTQIGSSQIFGASFGLERGDGRVGVTFFVRNLTNKRIPLALTQSVVSGFVGDGVFPLSGDYVQNLGPDSFRTFGLTVDFRI